MNKQISFPRGLQILSTIIVILGILLRYYHQFVHWAYNNDAVTLGIDILSNDYLDLLKPLESFQSAPPLFLILQKLISNIEPHYISLQIISFFSSCFSIIYFKKIIEKNGITFFTVCLLLIFTFNPFIIYHSLTLKQYTLDLCLALMSIHWFSKERSFIPTFVFFALWCLFSNVGLFFTAAFIINIAFQNFSSLQNGNFNIFCRSFFKKATPYIFAPAIYILYFIWYINQPGALELRLYMASYWEAWFLPLNKNIFWWMGIQLYRVIFFFFSTYIILGIMMFLSMLFGLYIIIGKNKGNIFFIRIYLFAISMHLILSVFHLYPFSDRLYLYMAPLLLYLSFYGFNSFLGCWKWGEKYKRIVIIIFSIALLILNMTYIGYKENDVLLLSKKLQDYRNHSIYRTPRADDYIKRWTNFTNYNNISYELSKSANQTNLNSLKTNDLVISRTYKKFGHQNITNKIETKLQLMMVQDKLKKVIEVDGYNVYLVQEQNSDGN